LQEGRSPEEALRALDRELAGLKPGAEFDREVERARNQLLLALCRHWTQNESVASFMGEYLSAAGDPVFAFEQVEQVEKAKAEDVLRVARQYLIPENRTVVMGFSKEMAE